MRHIWHHCSLVFVSSFLFLKMLQISNINEHMHVGVQIFLPNNLWRRHDEMLYFIFTDSNRNLFINFNSIFIFVINLLHSLCQNCIKIYFSRNTFYFQLIFFNWRWPYQNQSFLNRVKILWRNVIDEWKSKFVVVFLLHDDSFWKLHQYIFEWAWNLKFSLILKKFSSITAFKIKIDNQITQDTFKNELRICFIHLVCKFVQIYT